MLWRLPLAQIMEGGRAREGEARSLSPALFPPPTPTNREVSVWLTRS